MRIVLGESIECLNADFHASDSIVLLYHAREVQ